MVQKIPRESRRGNQAELLKQRIAELEGQLAEKSQLVSGLLQKANEAKRKTLIQPDGTLSFVCYCRAKGTRCAVLQISCVAQGLPRIRTALSVDGKDFRSVYARAVQLLAEAFGVTDDADLIKDMIATCDVFLASKSLRLVPIKYEQVLPID